MLPPLSLSLSSPLAPSSQWYFVQGNFSLCDGNGERWRGGGRGLSDGGASVRVRDDALQEEMPLQ